MLISDDHFAVDVKNARIKMLVKLSKYDKNDYLSHVQMAAEASTRRVLRPRAGRLAPDGGTC